MKKYFLYDYLGLGVSCTYLYDKTKHPIRTHESICSFHRALVDSMGFTCTFGSGSSGSDDFLIIVKVTDLNGKLVTGTEFRKIYSAKLKQTFLFLAFEELDN